MNPETFFRPLITLCAFLTIELNAQVYAPGVGVNGTSAMHKDSVAFENWALSCVVTRGYQDVSHTALGFVNAGSDAFACGKADGSSVVSLGDGGFAICTFAYPICNRPGPDFAVFENGFDDSFLELAFVEVSSDGTNFFRFPAHSKCDTTTQTGPFGATDPTKINNLAGKYRGGYGTPFDLDELTGKPGLNVNAITHVKVVDVVGSMNRLYASYDSYGNKVNDPWPTDFGSGGFDLDAVGVIHESKTVGLETQGGEQDFSVYPNPASVGQELKVRGRSQELRLELFDSNGRVVASSASSELTMPEGTFFVLRITSGTAVCYRKILVVNN